MAEQYVKLLCHWKGCEVFQNVGSTGSTDIVIVHPELGVLQVDVKCSQWYPAKNSWVATHAASVQTPVYAVCVIPEGDFSNWGVHWRNLRVGGSGVQTPIPHCPPGWENFWDNDNRTYTTK